MLKDLKKLGPLKSLKVCYEAGPTGNGLARSLMAAAVDCVVLAPGLVPQVAGARGKTDISQMGPDGEVEYRQKCHATSSRAGAIRQAS